MCECNNLLLIGTTSINRPELHSKVFINWLEWIVQLKKFANYKIVWFINIDYIENLPNSYEQTKNNFKDLSKNYVDEIIFTNTSNDTKGFSKACKNISTYIDKYIDKYNEINSSEIKNNINILWLEDDWEFNSFGIDLYNLISLYSTFSSVINLSFIRNNYIWALAPCIISLDFWKLYHSKYFQTCPELSDPENYLGINFLKSTEILEKNITNLSIINKKTDNKYFESNNFLSYPNSYYTNYNNIILPQNISESIKLKYIKSENIKNYFKSTNLFIRITPKMSNDVGRNYIKNFNLVKNFNSSDMYKSTKK